MKLLIDMNLSPRWVRFFHDHDQEASHWSTVGRPDAPDAEIMAWARHHGSIVLTHDLDFSAILAATRGEKPSVIQLRGDEIHPEAIGTQILSALAQMSEELEKGALLTIELDRTRLRILPLRLE